MYFNFNAISKNYKKKNKNIYFTMQSLVEHISCVQMFGAKSINHICMEKNNSLGN